MTQTNNKTNNVYEGKNGHDVTVNGEPLNQCHHIALYSDGFSWGYTGSGPMQLCLAIFIHEFGDNPENHPICYSLMKAEVIARFDRQSFTLTSTQIQKWLSTRRYTVDSTINEPLPF